MYIYSNRFRDILTKLKLEVTRGFYMLTVLKKKVKFVEHKIIA